MSKRPNPYIVQLNLTPYALDFLTWVLYNCDAAYSEKHQLYQHPQMVLTVRTLIKRGLVTATPDEQPVYHLTTLGHIALEFAKVEVIRNKTSTRHKC